MFIEGQTLGNKARAKILYDLIRLEYHLPKVGNLFVAIGDEAVDLGVDPCILFVQPERGRLLVLYVPDPDGVTTVAEADAKQTRKVVIQINLGSL